MVRIVLKTIGREKGCQVKSSPNRTITDLEGAVLLEVERMKSCTAYRIRQSFKNSPTPEWSASAGSIYPAIKRMIQLGWLTSSPREGDGRATETLSLTQVGKEALASWASDINRAISPGQDPFRLRISRWLRLKPKARQKLFHQLRASILKQLEYLDEYAANANIEVKIRTGLIRELQVTRLNWLDQYDDSNSDENL